MVAIFKSFNFNNNLEVVRNNQYRKSLQAKELELVLFHEDYKFQVTRIFKYYGIKPVDIADVYLECYSYADDKKVRYELLSLENFMEHVVDHKIYYKYQDKFYSMFDLSDLVLKEINENRITINDKLLEDD